MKRKSIKHIFQPLASSLCGQCCVAMAAGISLSKARRLVGHDRGTHGVELAKALRAAGVPVPRLRLVKKPFRRGVPSRCILRIRLQQPHGKPWTHWILRWDGRDYDPAANGRAYWIGRKPELISLLEIE